jgi:BirA family biotin operon repressor/biotin-[acetyl-CoA-carboxylase] ligase
MPMTRKRDPTPFLNSDEIRTATFIRYDEIHDALGSTNDRAAELARDANIELPALIAARLQTAGRGRGKNIWWSADGALTFSILLDPAALGIAVASWPQLSLAAAVAVCDAISNELNPKSQRPGIKWPNDVMLDGAKVSGILIESPSGAAPAKHRLIIGIGINVNNSWNIAPSDLESAGIALCDVIGHQLDRQNMLVDFLRALEQRLEQLAAHEATLPNAWQQLCSLMEQNIVVHVDGRSIRGRCLGIADDGALLVKTNFAVERLYSGSVRVES